MVFVGSISYLNKPHIAQLRILIFTEITKKNAGDRLNSLSEAINSLKLKKRGSGMMSRVDMDALESDINEAFFLLNRQGQDSIIRPQLTTGHVKLHPWGHFSIL